MVKVMCASFMGVHANAIVKESIAKELASNYFCQVMEERG